MSAVACATAFVRCATLVRLAADVDDVVLDATSTPLIHTEDTFKSALRAGIRERMVAVCESVGVNVSDADVDACLDDPDKVFVHCGSMSQARKLREATGTAAGDASAGVTIVRDAFFKLLADRASAGELAALLRAGGMAADECPDAQFLAPAAPEPPHPLRLVAAEYASFVALPRKPMPDYLDQLVD